MTSLKKLLPYIIIVIVILLYLDQCKKRGNESDINAALNDTLTIIINKDGTQTTKTSIITATSKRDLLRLETRNKEIKRLQRLLGETKRLISATVFSNSTAARITSTSTISHRDTIYLENGIEIYPTYWTLFKDEWQDFNVTANQDTFLIDYKVFNRYEITQAYEKRKKGLFRKRVPVITIHNLNPHTLTLELKSFAIKPKPRKYSIGVGAYYGISIPTGVPALIIGGGIQYNLLGR